MAAANLDLADIVGGTPTVMSILKLTEISGRPAQPITQFADRVLDAYPRIAAAVRRIAAAETTRGGMESVRYSKIHTKLREFVKTLVECGDRTTGEFLRRFLGDAVFTAWMDGYYNQNLYRVMRLNMCDLFCSGHYREILNACCEDILCQLMVNYPMGELLFGKLAICLACDVNRPDEILSTHVHCTDKGFVLRLLDLASQFPSATDKVVSWLTLPKQSSVAVWDGQTRIRKFPGVHVHRHYKECML